MTNNIFGREIIISSSMCRFRITWCVWFIIRFLSTTVLCWGWKCGTWMDQNVFCLKSFWRRGFSEARGPWSSVQSAPHFRRPRLSSARVIAELSGRFNFCTKTKYSHSYISLINQTDKLYGNEIQSLRFQRAMFYTRKPKLFIYHRNTPPAPPPPRAVSVTWNVKLKTIISKFETRNYRKPNYWNWANIYACNTDLIIRLTV